MACVIRKPPPALEIQPPPAGRNVRAPTRGEKAAVSSTSELPQASPLLKCTQAPKERWRGKERRQKARSRKRLRAIRFVALKSPPLVEISSELGSGRLNLNLGITDQIACLSELTEVPPARPRDDEYWTSPRHVALQDAISFVSLIAIFSDRGAIMRGRKTAREGAL